MNRLSDIYYTTENYLSPMLEEGFCEISSKMKDFLRILEVIRPSRFLTNALHWCGMGRPMQNREKIFRAFLMKSVYDFPTTKLLIENLRTNPSLRRLCGWEYSGAVPSEATFSRAFSEFVTEQILEEVHRCIIKENYQEKLVGHSSIDSTAISSREKSVQKKPVPVKVKKKRGCKSKAEKEALTTLELEEIETKRLKLQGFRSLEDNFSDLLLDCDWGGKRDSKGKTSYWRGYS